MRIRSSCLCLAAGVTMAWATSAEAGPIYSWDWENGDPGAVSHRGGQINWINSEFDTNTSRLSWYANFGDVPNCDWLKTDGFTLAINNGPNPTGEEGELALLYFDATEPSPELSVYGYNGRNDYSSYKDGSQDWGRQSPDRILSTKSPTASDWTYDLKNEAEVDGTTTMGFSIDVSQILAHDPMYPESDTWTGAQYGEQIGVWFHTFAGLYSNYDEDYLRHWYRWKEGWLDLTHAETRISDPVPEPATLALFGLGLTAGAILRRRKKAA